MTRKSWAYPDLPRYTWDQAHILRLGTARGFQVYGIPPSTIRRWHHEGRIKPSGKAPGGALLFSSDEVARVSGHRFGDAQ